MDPLHLENGPSAFICLKRTETYSICPTTKLYDDVWLRSNFTYNSGNLVVIWCLIKWCKIRRHFHTSFDFFGVSTCICILCICCHLRGEHQGCSHLSSFLPFSTSRLTRFLSRHGEHQVRLCRSKGHDPAGETTKQNCPSCKIIHM